MSLLDRGLRDDPLFLIQQRNQFYKKKYYLAIVIYLLSWVVIGVLVTALLYVIKNPIKPIYFVTDEVGKLIQDAPVTSPNMSEDAVVNWVIEASEAAFSYDFVNYRSQLQSAQKYFTDYGWYTYINGLKTSNNLLALTERKMIIIAKVIEKPKLIRRGILGGKFSWKYEMPMLVTYLTPPFDDKSRFQNPLLLTIVVQRQSILESYKGLGIVQMIGNLIFSPQQQQNLSLSPPVA